MTDKSRKDRVNVAHKQKYEYARLMAQDNYTNKQIMDISGAAASWGAHRIQKSLKL